jgi:hypothetical protein
MLWVCSDISKLKEFRDTFRSKFSNRDFVDLSKVPSSELIEQCESIASHKTRSCVFLGYLEPGWMLESPHQTRLRTLFRKFPVGFVCEFPISIPFSWKNEIALVYLEDRKDGHSKIVNHGDSVQPECKVEHNSST